MIVRIKDIFLKPRMARDVKLPHAMMGDIVEIIVGIEIVILRRDVDVVHIEENARVGFLHDFAEEFPLGHFRGVELRVAADVFDEDGNLQKIADFANPLRDMAGGGERVGERKKIVGVAAIDAAPAEMIGKPGRVGPFNKALDLPQMIAIQRIGRAQVHGDAMLDNAVLLQDLVEHVERTPAIDHEVFRDDLEPVGGRFARQDVLVMRHAQTDADPVIGKIVEAVRRHGLEGNGGLKDQPSVSDRLSGRPCNRPCPCSCSCRRSCWRRSCSRPCPYRSSCLCNRACRHLRSATSGPFRS